MRSSLFAISLLSSSLISPVFASGQSTFDDTELTKTTTFWQVYPSGGTELYCGQPFDNANNGSLVASPAYNVKQVKSALRCMTETQCTVKTPRYPFIVSDLHNFFPANATIEDARRNATFAEMQENGRRQTDLGCGTLATYHVIAPREAAKGEIARAMFYMHSEYMLPLDDEQLTMFKHWNRMDPPDAEEKARNGRIAELQGNRNPFIDKPDLADSLGQ